MARSMARPVAAPEDPRIEIRLVDAANVAAWVSIYCKAWDVPSIARRLISSDAVRALHDPSRENVLATFDGVPAGIATVSYLRQSAYFSNTAVMPRYRKRGIFRRLVQFRDQRARSRGYDLATLYAFADTSYPILKKLGFRAVFESPQYFYDAALHPQLRERTHTKPRLPAASARRISLPSPKAEPFKRRLAKVGYERSGLW
jgi:GNAT superfamily N-acetyltransferase